MLMDTEERPFATVELRVTDRGEAFTDPSVRRGGLIDGALKVDPLCSFTHVIKSLESALHYGPELPSIHTEPLVCLFACFLAPLTHGKVNHWMNIFSDSVYFSVLDHSALRI